jgi:glycine hydroxymethyltransferase
MPHLSARPWVPSACESLIQRYASETAEAGSEAIDALAEDNRRIHERDCFNLNPAANVMNPRAEALLSSRLGSRPSLGYPGDKYEMGLEAIEEIEVIAAELAAEVFDATPRRDPRALGRHREPLRLHGDLPTGDTIIAPPAAIGGHVTHHDAGCAGLYGLRILPAPVAADGYTVDTPRWKARPHRTPPLITIGGSLNLDEHPVASSRHRRRGGRDAPVRRGASMRDHRRARVEEPARRRRAPDDHEHLQEPRRTGRRADRHQ